MFQRLILEESTAVFTVIAFLTAVSIHAAFTWRALRMKPVQVRKMENLPFETPTPPAGER